ncbi:CDP-glucose 4,6-dehydratase [Fluviibacterium sp. DFM31]|uniref:CDP-glucose 4,6-dehydratase n=1 Tax=Meridianimarinicoccus marinus TaxID=3231483 RepID=A0ABV3L6L8_9RHOB
MSFDRFKGRRVLVTGHTGFKGAWLCAWLVRCGARVTGYALAPETDPNLWQLLGLSEVDSHIGDLNDRAALDSAIAASQPEFVFHLAAQALVRRSYREPVETFASNVLGTVQLLDALRGVEGLQSVIVATSDKAYANVEQIWGYRETDPMGGHDPYSASKGATELATAAMRASFFGPDQPVRVATVRAGNVIGGGDWAEDRLVPDIVRGCLGGDGHVTLRQPFSIRPWQHVLEPLSGYMMLALAQVDRPEMAEGWNFGPDRAEERPVDDVARAVVAALGQGAIRHDPAAADLHEARLLRLDVSKARVELGWRPLLDFAQTIDMTAGWYGRWSRGASVRDLCSEQIEQFEMLMGSS